MNGHKGERKRLQKMMNSTLICILLFLVIMFVIFQRYVTRDCLKEIVTDKSRCQLEHHEDIDNLKSANLNSKKEELPCIKEPVNNGLRDLESKLLLLQKEISTYKANGVCRMHSCFDFSKCPLVGGFPVFAYEFQQNENLNEFVKSSVFHLFKQSPYVVQQPEKACIFIAVFGEPISTETVDTLESRIKSLDHWNGDGRNHVLLDITRNANHVDSFKGVDTGRAIIVQSSFIETLFRPNFDLVIPPSYGHSDGPVWSELPPLTPVRRPYFLSFLGYFKDPGEVLSTVPFQQDKYSNKIEKNIDITTREGLMVVESSIVQTLKRIISDSKEKVFLKFVCDNSSGIGIKGEWCLCDSASERLEILRKSTFSIIVSPANHSIISTTVFQTRFYEALKHGAIPVILGDYTVLPFNEIIDWRNAVIFLPKARVPELHFMLKTITDNDLMDYKWYGRTFWETYFATTSSIISTVLAVLRTRLQIPAYSVKEEPSVSSIGNFIPVPGRLGVNPGEETDEVLGPVEPPFASAKFTKNFTSQTLHDMFNRPGDPFHLYPFTPFVKVLPSDAKFTGSGYNFRPVNKGKGGTGKEFSEALGGNHPREQFTVVVLTYERPDILIKAITRLKGLPYLNKVIVVWNNPTLPSEKLGWPDIGVPVVVVKTKKNSLNNRFLPFEAIETEAVLSIDDDTHLRHDEIIFGFRVWREERDHLVGFPGRSHAWDVKHKAWLYNIDYSCEISMVLTGAAFFHKYYAYLYTYSMPQAIRDKVDEYMNCEDIALNFLISHITRKPPIKVEQ